MAVGEGGARIQSVNVGQARPTEHSDFPTTGIDKRPVDGPVEVRVPASASGPGLAGDAICDSVYHGGPDQAVYAFAREDLDEWEGALGRPLRSGMFGENLTTLGIDVNRARVGERWRIGERLVLEVSDPRIPCRTFAGFLEEKMLVKRFTERGAPGTYLRVIEPGPVRAGDPLVVVSRPEHDVTVALTFRALTLEPALLPRLSVATALSARMRAKIADRLRGA